ncbi:MAG: ABC transporter substrate-binding protein [Ferrovibrio sp.]
MAYKKASRFLMSLMAAAALAGLTATSALAQGVLRIGMTASDIPLTTGQTDQGGEGMRFMGYTVYDALINWDLSKFDKPSVLMPGLATKWGVDATDKTKWTFTLREGVKFHDGSEFTADAVVWNLDKLLKKDAPQFDPRQSAQGLSRIPAVASYKTAGKYTVEIVTKTPDPHDPGRPAALPDRVGHDVLAGAVGKAGKKLGCLRQDPVGHRPVEAFGFRAA